MQTVPRLSAKEWKNLRSRRLVGPKLNGAPVPCVDCGEEFVRIRGARSLCSACSHKADDARQNAKRAHRQAAREAEEALAEWLEFERMTYNALDAFQRASYELSLREMVATQRDTEREEASQYEYDDDDDAPVDESTGERRRDRENAALNAAFGGPGRYVIEKPLNQALSPDGPDEGYSTYFLPRTEDGYLEAGVAWEWRTDEAAKWWRRNPHAFADLR